MGNDPNSSPLAFYGSELKRLRQRAGMTLAELAKKTNYALSTVSAYENGRLIPSHEFSVSADEAFGTEGDLTRLQAMVERVSVRPWFRDRVEVERKAREIKEYESYQIPGLLQTEDYARALMSATRPVLSDEMIERFVALRMTRQELLEPDDELPADQEQTPRFWAVIDESALHRIVGSPEIMQAQREHLIKMAQRPNVTIQIIPNAQGAASAFGRAFTILVFKNNSSVVYIESIDDAQYIRDLDKVSRYTLIFDHLRSTALNDAQSLKPLRGEDI